ncbi:MAG: family 78 glycoside hydrolase catalytic domain [Acutalibacteraceae bacterium]|nr:family 78 glycoside hydrolase catalytic domain [Acutalibacteraceae bacterium]
MFSNASFIKATKDFDLGFVEDSNRSVLFRKKFVIDSDFASARLSFCALGLGYAFLNGKDVTDELFAPPYANYNKRIWYVQYDVTDLLYKGENIISFMLGNGMYNEDMPNDWWTEKASWRDQPKLICQLDIDGKTVLISDESFLCSTDSPYVMNRLRTGVIYDARKYDSSWKEISYDDSGWNHPVIDENSPKGKFSLCSVEGMKEYEKYAPVHIIDKSDGRVIFDFGYNHSGIIHFATKQKAGDMITFRYAESLDGNLELNYNERTKWPYKENELAMDRYICDGKGEVWANRFAYHGFRFVECTGINKEDIILIESVFVHQDIKRRSTFECSNEILNKLFNCGIRSTFSNMFYNPIDCPTREKLGWMNDAQSSCEQFLTDFHLEKLLSKWVEDMKDAMLDSGELPGIVPTHGWGYEWGNGPVSDGCFFETPYRIYLHSGQKECLTSCIPYYHRYFDFLETKEDEKGLVKFGLRDWANPRRNGEFTPTTLINALLRIKFSRIAALACDLAGEDASRFENEIIRQEKIITKNFLEKNGRCNNNEQTACAMLIYFGIGNREVLAEQLLSLIEYEGGHHMCGMVGLRYLYMALNMTGNQEIAYRIISRNGYPSYYNWLLDGATTLYEFWDSKESKNHHMYSDFMSWMMKTIVGISPDDNAASFDIIEIAPYFFNELKYAKGSYESVKGEIKVEWKRVDDKIELLIVSPQNNFAYYNGKVLDKGENRFII